MLLPLALQTIVFVVHDPRESMFKFILLLLPTEVDDQSQRNQKEPGFPEVLDGFETLVHKRCGCHRPLQQSYVVAEAKSQRQGYQGQAQVNNASDQGGISNTLQGS